MVGSPAFRNLYLELRGARHQNHTNHLCLLRESSRSTKCSFLDEIKEEPVSIRSQIHAEGIC